MFDPDLDSSFQINEGESFQIEEEPIRNGYQFQGWYTEESLVSEYDFDTLVVEDLELYAKWVVQKNPEVTIIVENFGTIVVELYPDVAPNTVNSFIKNIQDGVYTDNEIHRVIENFVIQGGATNVTCRIEAEVNNNPSFRGTNNMTHDRGAISMARTSVYNSATTQFFLVHQDASFLDDEYAAFGMIIEGFNVLDSIATVNTDMYDGPLLEVVIESITVELFENEYPDPVCE